MADIVNRNELRITGMSRSGNHAIINWIMSQAHGRICFLNCTEPKSNPFETARPMKHGNAVEVTYRDFDLDEERQGRFSAKDYLMYSHEDCFLGTISKGFFEENHDTLVGPSARRTDLLILRDPFNLFASRLKSGYSEVAAHIAIRIWKQHARDFTGERRYLPRDRVPISYNAWATDRDYRRQVAGRLGLEFTDAGFEDVAKTGGGSSFDGLQFDRRASQMKVFERWKHFAGNDEYCRIFDAEMVRLSEAIFGHLPGTEVLCEAACSS